MDVPLAPSEPHLVDHGVCRKQERLGNLYSERFRRALVDSQRELRGLLHRELRWTAPAENASHVDCGTSKHVEELGASTTSGRPCLQVTGTHKSTEGDSEWPAFRFVSDAHP